MDANKTSRVVDSFLLNNVDINTLCGFKYSRTISKQYKYKTMNEFMDYLSVILKIVMAIMFLWGVIKIAYGFYNIKQGESGMSDIIGGAGMAVAPFLMYAVYEKLGMSSSAIDMLGMVFYDLLA